MTDYALWIISGIFAGIILHALATAALPNMLPKEIWKKVENHVETDSFVILESESDTGLNLPRLDPAMEHAICRFSIASAPRVVRGTMHGFYWSVAIFNTNSEVIYSTNNRLLQTDSFSLILGTREQLPQIIQNSVAEFSNVKVIQLPDEEVFVILRAFRPDMTMQEQIRGLLSRLSCEPLETASYSPDF